MEEKEKGTRGVCVRTLVSSTFSQPLKNAVQIGNGHAAAIHMLLPVPGPADSRHWAPRVILNPRPVGERVLESNVYLSVCNP